MANFNKEVNFNARIDSDISSTQKNYREVGQDEQKKADERKAWVKAISGCSVNLIPRKTIFIDNLPIHLYRFFIKILSFLIIKMVFVYNQRHNGVIYSVAQFKKEEVLVLCKEI